MKLNSRSAKVVILTLVLFILVPIFMIAGYLGPPWRWNDGLSLEVPDLHKAAATADLDTMRNLIANGSDVNSVDANGWTPLFYAVRSESLESFIYLVNQGASLANRNTRGENVIEYASSFGHSAFLADALDKCIAGAGGRITMSYDAAGRMLSIRDQLNHATTYSYDALDR